jgi:hypothetical protein
MDAYAAGAGQAAWLPEPRRAALCLGPVIVLLGVLGAVDLLAPSWPLAAFSLDGERTLPAFFSALLLLGAGLLAGQLSGEHPPRLSATITWSAFMAIFLVFMSLDELLGIHEHVSASVTGVSWQVFYAPVVVLAAVAWFVVLRRLPNGSARTLWVAGAAAWFVSQVIEAIQWDGDRLVHPWTIVPEEMLEMAGTLAWGLALVIALRKAREQPEAEGDYDGGTAAEPLTRASRQRHGRRRRARGPKPAAPRPGAATERTPSSR